MSFSPPKEVSSTVDENQQDVEAGVGGESEGVEDDDTFYVSPSNSLDTLQKRKREWRKVALVLDAHKRFQRTVDLKGKGIVADVTKSLVSRCRTVVYAVRAVQRFKEAGQSRKRGLQVEIQCIGQSLAHSLRQKVLHQRPYSTGHSNKQYQISDTICAIFAVCFVLAISGMALHSRIVPWPIETHFDLTGLPENTGEGVIVTCESYLISVNDTDTKTTGNMCVKADKLETITVVMFSDMAKALMDEKMEDSSKRLVTKRLEGGMSVTQEAYDLIELVHPTVHAPLAPLFLGGYKQDDKYRTIEYLLQLMNFPQDYLRLSWIYDCNNCISCSLEAVMNLSRSVVPGNEASWVSCFYYGGRTANKCRSRNRYIGECKLYPTEKMPRTLAVQKFLEVLSELSGIRDIRASKNAHHQRIKLEPSVLYLNISHALSSSILLGFMEVEEGSSTWTMLLSSFPTVKKDCTKLPRVPVCNGTSVCNMFRNADSYELRCLDFRNHTQCKLLLQDNVDVPDYLTNKVEQTGEILCPTAFNCLEEAPYLVGWKTPERMENDALNSFLGSKKLNEEWAKRSGVCTNTYRNVIRYHPPTADGSAGASAKENVKMFLESKCTEETPTQPSYCVPTGRYHTQSDNPGANWKDLGELSLAVTTRIKWKRVKRMGFGKWCIAAFGSVLSWTGSAVLAFDLVFALFCYIRRFLAPLSKSKVKHP